MGILKVGTAVDRTPEPGQVSRGPFGPIDGANHGVGSTRGRFAVAFGIARSRPGTVAVVSHVRQELVRREMAQTGRQVMRETNDTPAGDDSLEVTEVETEGVDEEGNLVIDELVVAVDSEGKIVATDETVAVITSEGHVVVDETLSVVGEDGKLHAVEEDISALEDEG